MKASRAIVEHGIAAVLLLLGGIVVFVLGLTGTEPRFDTFARVALALLLVVATIATRFAVRGLRRIEPSPEAVTIVSTRSVAARTGLANAIVVGAIIYGATPPSRATWIVGLSSILVGAVMAGSAAAVARVERKRGRHVLRMNNRYFFAH